MFIANINELESFYHIASSNIIAILITDIVQKAKMATKTKLSSKFKSAASTNSGRVHVVPSKGGWSVKKEGASRSVAVKPTKEGALNAAKNLKSVERIVIHKKDGTIQKNTKKRK